MNLESRMTVDDMNGKSSVDDRNTYVRSETSDSKGGKKVVIDERFWNKQLRNWYDGNGPRPGPHPDPNHKYNTHPEAYDMD